jgi:hypothetical protein
MAAISRTVEVTSPAAQEMLEELARLGGIGRPYWQTQRFALPPPDSSDEIAVDALQFTSKDAQEMRERLEESGLDLLLPGGLDSLPDITASTPWQLRPLLRLGLPRSYRQLARHVARHLDWYLNPEGTAITLHRLSPWLAVFSLCALGWLCAVVVLWLLAKSGFFGADYLLALAFFALFVPSWVFIVLNIVGERDRVLKPSERDRFNARQLYYYLLDSYADWD